MALPKGLTCTGGATKNKCLVSFTTAGGFGNCAVVQTAAGAKQAVPAAAGKKGKTAARDVRAVVRISLDVWEKQRLTMVDNV